MTPLHDHRTHTRWWAAFGQPGHPWTRAGWLCAMLILLSLHGVLLMTIRPTAPASATAEIPAERPAAPELRPDPGERAWADSRQIPWDDWIQGLESRLPGDVALVMLEPDPQAGRIDVEAHATSLPPLLRLGEALEAWEYASRVDPVTHQPPTGTPSETTTSGSGGAVRMRWRISVHGHRKPL